MVKEYILTNLDRSWLDDVCSGTGTVEQFIDRYIRAHDDLGMPFTEAIEKCLKSKDEAKYKEFKTCLELSYKRRPVRWIDKNPWSYNAIGILLIVLCSILASFFKP